MALAQPILVPASTQVVDPGVVRVGESDLAPTTWAWVIDTGVDLDHPDLNVELAFCRSMFRTGSRASSRDDFHGHGTHVAGIIGAIDNTIGTKGVAPGASVVGVKTLANNGRGNWRKVIRAVDYTAGAAMPGDVANMSLWIKLRTNRRQRLLRDAVLHLAAQGVFVTICAGNNAEDVGNPYPAAV